MKIQRFTFNMFGVNTYVLWDGTTLEAAIIDPGMLDDSENAQIYGFIEKNRLQIKHIINTHLHIDHTFGIDHATAKYGCPVEGHPADDILGQNRSVQARMFGIPLNLPPVTVAKRLDEGDTVMIGDEPLNILHVPGHSPGSIVLYAPESGFIISGDVLFRSSIGRTDLTQGNYEQLISGISTKLLVLPEDTVVYPGHGPATTIGEEIAHNPYLA